jgi:hypothetical protein
VYLEMELSEINNIGDEGGKLPSAGRWHVGMEIGFFWPPREVWVDVH